jgi:hypothetical protein
MKVKTTVLRKEFSKEVNEHRSIRSAFELVYKEALTYLCRFPVEPEKKNKFGIPVFYRDSKVWAGKAFLGCIMRNGEFNPNYSFLTEYSKKALELNKKQNKKHHDPNMRYLKIEFDEDRIAKANQEIL